MAAEEAASRPPSLVTANSYGMHHARPKYSRAAALLLASSLLLLGVSSVVYLAGPQSGGAVLEEDGSLSWAVTATQGTNPREEAAIKLEKWGKQVDEMETQVKAFQADANAKAVNELVHLERVKDLLDELKSQVPETPPPAPVHWGYGDGPEGPAHWGELKSDYATCADGKKQSPINFELNIKEATLPSLGWTYADDGVGVSSVKGASQKIGREFYSGRTFEVEDLGAPTFLVDGVTYTLQQLHMHTPSEHRVAGRHYDMELHFVHSAEVDGVTKFAVVAAFFQQGATTPSELKKLVRDAVPKATEEPAALVEGFDFKNLAQSVLVGTVPSKLEAADAFVPNFKNYFQYQGSFTTPPCSEGVTWVVLKNPIDIELSDLDAVKEREGKNNRPVQPLNGREVLDVGGKV